MSARTRTIAKPPPPCIITPFTVAVDTREQAPYTFSGLCSDAVTGHLPIVVKSERIGLPSGDYGIVGCESGVVVERKSATDLFGTLGGGRRRFQAELARLSDPAEHGAAFIVVEAEWSEILGRPPARSRLRPKTVFRSVIAWQFAFPRIHWWFMPGRRASEVITFRLLERWWRVQAS